MKEELAKLYYLDMKNEHQLDVALREASIVLNRKRIDLTSLRKKVLQQYYKDVISPSIRKAFDDSDFAVATKMFLAGGGSHYSDLVEMFEAEFDGFTAIEVSKNAAHLAAIGYWHQSLIANGGDESKAVGIDIGNASTVVCTVKK
jgi:plasmid segregation protein ParM